MKIILFAFILYSVICTAPQGMKKIQLKDLRNEQVQPNTLVENKNLDKYEGNWIWGEGAKKFTMVFRKQNVTLPITNGSFVVELLLGAYSYFVENEEIELEPKRYHFLGSTEHDNGSVIFSFPNKNISTTYLELIYLDSNTLRLQISANIREGGLAAKDFLIPINITLKRII